MAAVIGDEITEDVAPGPTRRANAGWRRLPVWRWVILAVVGAFFIIPLVAAVRFTGFSSFPAVFHQVGFSAAFELSVKLAFITTVATLVLMLPSFLGCVLLLFGSAFSSYATAEALTSGSVPLTAIQIGSFLNGNVIAGQANVGKALGLGMVLVATIAMVAYILLQRRVSKWSQ